MVELPFCVVGGPKGHKHIIWVGGPQGHKQIQPTREKIVLAFSMGNCKMNYGKDKKEKKEKR